MSSRVLIALVALAACSSPASSEQSVPQTIAFDTPAPHILVPAAVNGVAGVFILDTGVKAMWLNKPYAEKAGIEREREIETTSWFFKNDPRVKAVVAEGTAETVEFFGRVQRHVAVNVMDINPALENGFVPDGFLGLNQLRGGEVCIDMDRETLIIK
jgi:hypothetical protein